MSVHFECLIRAQVYRLITVQAERKRVECRQYLDAQIEIY